jgi:hypothetical protein
VPAGGDGDHVEDAAHGCPAAVDSRRSGHGAALTSEGATPMSADAALLSTRPSSGTEARRTRADFTPMPLMVLSRP